MVKFRVWDYDRKKFAKQILTFKFDRVGNINLVVYIDKINKNGEIYEKDKVYCNNFVIQQYIGAKDGKGRKVYEGDIVETTFYSQKVLGIIKYKVKYIIEGVIYATNKFIYPFNAIKCEKFDISLDKYIIPNINNKREINYIFDGIVIGNVFENPEILNLREVE